VKFRWFNYSQAKLQVTQLYYRGILLESS